jgi:hypothetical protein
LVLGYGKNIKKFSQPWFPLFLLVAQAPSINQKATIYIVTKIKTNNMGGRGFED